LRDEEGGEIAAWVTAALRGKFLLEFLDEPLVAKCVDLDHLRNDALKLFTNGV